MYYLQSRYYDPTTCRFINADAYASTGQGMLGNNMFAYCLNNPICFADIDGEEAGLWGYLFADGDPGFIHRMVQLHILLVYNAEAFLYSKEFVMPGVGRADIIKPSTMEIWEIKYAGKVIQTRIDLATSQVERYERAFSSVGRGSKGEFNGSFIINCIEKSYLISYTTPSEGVIIYTLTPLEEYSNSPFATFVPSTVPVEKYFPSPEKKTSRLVFLFGLCIPRGADIQAINGTGFGVEAEIFG